MINIKNLKVGQTLYLVRKGYENNTHKRELDKISKAEVIKVGRKYVTVSLGGYFETFDSQENFKIYKGYKQMKQGLYLCAEDYFDELKKEKLLRKIRDSFNYSNKQCEMLSLEDLESISSIIDRCQE